MESLRDLLPSANALIVFEAAGRHRSFTRAAEELAMTQAAVSFSIRKLEDDLETRLFTRRHRSVSLTEAGARFHADVSLGLTHIRKAAEELRSVASERHVTLSASTAFASYWMLPRLQRFRSDLPGVDLRIQTSERDVDILQEGVPLAIRAGRSGAWPGCADGMLAAEQVEAVVSPTYVEQFGMPNSVEEIAGHRLIHLEEPFRPATDWEDFFRSAGVQAPARAKGLLINDYVLVVQAVLGGQGIALGWRHLTEPLIRAGLLLPVTGHVLATEHAYHLVWPADRSISAHAVQVRDWILANAARSF